MQMAHAVALAHAATARAYSSEVRARSWSLREPRAHAEGAGKREPVAWFVRVDALCARPRADALSMRGGRRRRLRRCVLRARKIACVDA
jgi:hypothetical protein